MGEHLSRRSVLTRGGALGLASILPPAVLAACANDRARPAPPSSDPTTTSVAIGPMWSDEWRELTDHEADVIVEATARLIPGPADDPAESGSPGAREANVTRYIDTMLSALSLTPAAVFAGGPASDRAGSDVNDMATPVGLTAVQQGAWRDRLQRVRAQYTAGVTALDAAAGGSFRDVTVEERDAILLTDPDGFTTLLFSHAIEGMYSAPEYGGNADGVGWHSISFGGDSQPRGYSGAEVTDSDGPDAYVRAGIGDRLLALLAASGVG